MMHNTGADSNTLNFQPVLAVCRFSLSLSQQVTLPVGGGMCIVVCCGCIKYVHSLLLGTVISSLLYFLSDLFAWFVLLFSFCH